MYFTIFWLLRQPKPPSAWIQQLHPHHAHQGARDDKAAGLADRIMHNSDTEGIESLKWMDPGAVAEMIGNEHPQIIATILVHLEPDQAAEILKMFSERTRNDALLRISTLDGVQPVALRELNDVLGKLMAGGGTGKKALQGGWLLLLKFSITWRHAGSGDDGKCAHYDPDLAQKIEDKMFVFETCWISRIAASSSFFAKFSPSR